MQDAKNFAFLMHPTRTTNTTEGSRLALGHEGGCIKKAPAGAGASRIAAALEGLGCHGSGRLGGLGFAGLEVVPVLLPVMRAQLLACYLPAEMLFEGQAVVWGEWLEAMSPVPDIATVWIPEDPRDFGMVVTSQGQDLFVSFDLHEREV